jgi:hypothetical protein
MSDVGIAPAPSAPPPAEVPINPAPVSTPTPVPATGPDKPVDPKSAEPRRDAIQRAFDRARDRPAPKPAEAKMGHNQPPEETPVERAKPKTERPPPIDLKKRPDDQPKAPEPQPRERGRFTARAVQEGVQNSTAPVQTDVQPARQLPEGTPYREPPPRLHEKAKAEWHATPESVRGEMHRMHHDFSKAYQGYRADHETMNSIRPYHQMAQEHGTTLDKALNNYVSMEHKLRNDVIGGLDVIVSNLNLQTPDGRKITLPDIAYHILNQTPEQHKLVQSQNTQMAQSHQLAQANQRISGLENAIQQMHHAAVFNQTRGAVDQFAVTHPRTDELASLIEQEVKLGFDLETAYRRAELLSPATHAAQTRTDGTHAAQTRTHTAQTRTSDRSISGAPGGPLNGSTRRSDKPVGRREAIANAIKRANGSL